MPKTAGAQKIRTTIPDLHVHRFPDLIGRDFHVGGSRAKEPAGDITYVPTDEGWLYLADVLDLHRVG